jgi:predicted dehydrogenase
MNRESNQRVTRREFASQAAWAAGAGAVAAAGMRGETVRAQTTASASRPAVAPSPSRDPNAAAPVRLGFIGVGNRGDQVLSAFLNHKDAQVVALCDLHRPYLDFAAKKVGGDVEAFTDYRRMLDRKDVDAVVINTPDHWHALQTIHALQAGKDVYVEKPLSLTVAEGRAMVEAARRYGRVAQVGLHRRSSEVCRKLAEFIRAGGIGKVTVARAFHIQNESPLGIGRPADSEPPAGFDWDAWLGPAPQRPYNVNRTFYRFRWFYDYSGGQVTNTGAHYLDLIQWALGEDAPRSVAAMGGKAGDFDNREVPDTLEAMWTYPSGTLVTFSQFNASSAEAAARPCEVEFRGTKGTLYYQGDEFVVVPETPPTREYPILNPLDRAAARGWRAGKAVIAPLEVRGNQPNPTIAHARNFLDCVRTRAACHCDLETGHRSTTATLIANIALKTRAVLEWDAQAERFTNHDAANALLHYEYRKPYELPALT